ncbi:MAG TPA: helix-turn-helix domain-containing protein [Rubrobacteraceae bacterium]|nr:helix-turn-helix domain-containing protein [Rubrobacteraceae bacterium]
MAIANEGEWILAPDKNAPTVQELNAFREENEGLAKLIAPSGETLELPPSVYDVVMNVIDEVLVKGNSVKVMSVDAELTTQQAAELLNVSRPFLIKLLERGEIQHRKVGTHRRIRFEDILVYRDQRDAERRSLLGEITRESQELGLYNEDEE